MEAGQAGEPIRPTRPARRSNLLQLYQYVCYKGRVIFLAVIFGVPVLCWAIVLMRADRVTHPTAYEWALERRLDLTAESQPMVVWYLRNTRVLRTLGVLAGFVLPPLVGLALGKDLGPMTWIWPFVGYLVGTIYAELSLVRPTGRAAGLTPRRLRNYLPRRVLLAQRVLGVLIAAAALLALRIPAGIHPLPVLQHAAIIAAAVIGVVTAIGLELIESAVVRRPQPIVSKALLEADDAIRAQSVLSVAGSGIAILLMLFSLPMWAAANSEVVNLRRTMWAPALLCVMASLFACLTISHQPVRVRRSAPIVL
jgi:hypothetical protein